MTRINEPEPDSSATGIRFVPRVSRSVVSRPRLSKAFDDSLAGALTIVRAPAGAGKSTAIADWATRVDAPAGVWLTLGGAPVNRSTFWRTLLDALIDGRIAGAESAFAGVEPSPSTAGSLLSILLRGFARLPEPLLIVIDDYHLVADDAVHDDLVVVLERTPLVHVIVATRAATALENAENATRIDTRLIQPTALSFTEEETIEVIVSARPESTTEEARHIHDVLGGWPLATRAFLLEAEHSGDADIERTLASVAAARFSDRLGGEVVSTMTDPDLLLFALRTSIAQDLSPDLADALAPGTDVEAMLGGLERDGLGALHRADGTLRFRYQPVVRAALEAELRRRLPTEVAPLRATLARWLAENGRPYEAIAQYNEVRDWASMVGVVQRNYTTLIYYHGADLLRILSGIPSAQLRRHPLLLVLLALVSYASPSTPAERLRSLANMGMTLLDMRLGRVGRVDQVWLLTALLGSQRMGGKYAQAAASGARLAELVGSLSAEERDDVVGILPSLYNHIGTGYLYVERADAALPMFAAAKTASVGQSRAIGLHADSLAALVSAMSGDMVETRRRIAEIDESNAFEGWRGTYFAAGFHLAESIERLENFDPDGAMEQVDMLAEHAPTIEHWPLLLRSEGLAMLARGAAFDGATELASKVATRGRRTPTSSQMRGLLALTQADLLLAAGQPARAARVLAPYDAGGTSVQLGLARVALATSRPEEALARVEELVWTEAPVHRARAEALLTKAVATAALGQASAAVRPLELALEIMDARGLRRPLMMLPREPLLDLLTAYGDWRGAPAARLLDGVPDVFSSFDVVERLTAREIMVIKELAETPQIALVAEHLFVSPNTVKSQVRSIYRKLGVSSREDAVLVARDRGLLDSA